MPLSDEFNWKVRITIDPGIQAGHPVITGTRVPVEVILGAMGGGESAAEICEGYNLTEDDVRAALIYAAEIVAKQRARAIPGR